MAQSKSFFGLRKGSTKSLTFQVLNGKQITKDRVYNVKNPQTIAQMQQRALMATVVNTYSKLKTICDHSIEGVEVGSKTMGEFIKNNLLILKNRLPEINLTSYKESDFALNEYMVSKGTLPAFDWGKSTDETTSKTYYEFITQGKWEENMTYKVLAEKCGLSVNGMLTLMVVTEEGELQWLRLKFTPTIIASDTKITEKLNIMQSMLAIDADSVEGNTIELEGLLTIIKDGTDIAFRVDDMTTEGATMIKSQKTENVWRRSTNYLKFDFQGGNYELAFATYPINTTLLLNGGKMPSNIIAKK